MACLDYLKLMAIINSGGFNMNNPYQPNMGMGMNNYNNYNPNYNPFNVNVNSRIKIV